MIPRTAAAAILALGLAAPAPAGADEEGSVITLSAGLHAWFSTLDGTGRVDAPGSPGTRVDLEDTLGVDTEEMVLVPYAHMGLGSHHLLADFWSHGYEGTKTLTQAVTYHGTTFTAATTVKTNVDLAMGSLLYHWAALSPSAGMSLDLGPVIGIKYLKFDGDITSGGTTASESFTGAVPVIGVRGRVGVFEMAEVSAILTGVTGHVGGVDATVWDGSVEAAVNYMHLSAGLGYRLLHLDGTLNQGGSDETEVDFEMKGVYATVSVYF